MSATVQLTDVNLAYERGGPNDAPLVILLGGLTVPMSAWGQLAPALHAEGVQTLAFDYAGRGHSSLATSTPDLSQHVRHVSELVDALALGPTLALVGWSFGALVAAGLAVRRP